MNAKHISDSHIQEYILDRINCSTDIIEHIEGCPRCKAKAATYQYLFSEIRQQARPDFDFDLTTAVLSEIEHKEDVYSWSNFLTLLFILLGISSVLSISFLFGKYLVSMFTNVSSMTLGILVTSATTFLLIQGIEMLRRHGNQMKLLVLDEELQQ